VTEAQVWDALAEIPDPEIPVISLVDLGVVKDVHVDGRNVQIEFTPTFLGCPALEVMRDAMAEKVRELGGEPDVQVVLDDSWSTDKITPEGREKLRESGFAPPSPRAAQPLQLVELQRNTFRVRTATPPTPSSTTSSARPHAAACATATPAGSRSSSSRRSRRTQGLQTPYLSDLNRYLGSPSIDSRESRHRISYYLREIYNMRSSLGTYAGPCRTPSVPSNARSGPCRAHSSLRSGK